MISLLNFLRKAFGMAFKFMSTYKLFIKFKVVIMTTIKLAILTLFLTLALFILERFIYCLELISSVVQDVALVVPDVLLEHMEFANYLFPFAELFYLLSVLATVWSAVLVIKVLKSISPTIDGNKL